MSKKCALCKGKIGVTFLDKLDGTIIKTGEGGSSNVHYICSDCQREYKKDLKEKVERL